MLLLLEFSQIISSHTISLSKVSCLEVIYDRYLDLRVLMFPNTKLRTKHHYVQHYAYLTKLYGPLIKFSTLRYESKHQYFKQIATKARNFINIEKTLTGRHQILQSTLFEKRFSLLVESNRFFLLHLEFLILIFLVSINIFQMI